MVGGISHILVPLSVIVKGGGVISRCGSMARLDSVGAPSAINCPFPNWRGGGGGSLGIPMKSTASLRTGAEGYSMDVEDYLPV